MEIVLIVAAGFILFSIYMLFRVNWVFKHRMAILKNEDMALGDRIEMYDKLPTFDGMLYDIFNWDINKYLD